MKGDRVRNYLKQNSVYKPKYFEKINFNQKLNFVTVFCPFVKQFKDTDRYIFSGDILHMNKIVNNHFTLENSSYAQINPKVIALSWEIPHIIMGLLEINANFSWQILIADELKSNMLTDSFIENLAREKMLASVKKALNIGLATLIGPNIVKNVSVKLTSSLNFEQEKSSELINLLSKLYSKRFFQKILLKKKVEYIKVLEDFFLESGNYTVVSAKKKSFEEAAYRSVLAELVRKQNTIFISAQPPEIGDEFHGSLTNNVMPTLFLIKNVEGENKIDDVFMSRIEKQKFINLLEKEL